MTFADPLRLSRRDRAALTLALEWARVTPGRGGGPHIAVSQAYDALLMGTLVALGVAGQLQAARDRWPDHVRQGRQYQASLDRWRRLLRARLALLIRAVLRADRGDFGPTVWVGCSCQCDGDQGGPRPLRYRPLWQIERGAK